MIEDYYNDRCTLDEKKSSTGLPAKKMDLGIDVCEDTFGDDGQGHLVRRFTLTNEHRMSVQVINYGATITCIKVPDKRGNVDDVVLGFDDMSGYLSSQNPYFGATIGRVTNRTFPTDFLFNGQHVSLSKNVGGVHLHGGFRGFDKVIWDAFMGPDRVTMTYLSPDGEEGYPGAVLTTVTFQLTPDNRLIIGIRASVTRPTPVNITNHAYFNLAGHASGAQGLLTQVLSVNADKYTPLENFIATGEIREVAGSGYDLRIPKQLAEAFKELDTDGYDINFCLNNSIVQPGFNFAARLFDPESGRYLEVHTDQPGLQVYTSNGMPAFNGKRDAAYGKHTGICFETQNYPNAVNIETFPSIIVKPGTDYVHYVAYSFGTVAH
ncbi:galactose mutarotase-like isoform X2 [Macrosteles quadrilineatus]|uniref:galactose mutarotase-like isoform X2 n=1 Tax=Macrosteles quadrilineatus TaxID=74068 RepID=UPI0023E23744|nr:galactose mutarotase-like isoform X2 [Macrosteles quadrilineatus]